MKKILFVVILSYYSNTNSQNTEFNEDILTKTILTKNGIQTNFADAIDALKGQNVVLVFWDSSWSNCIKNLSKIKELQESNPKLPFIFISVDTNFKKWIETINKHNIKSFHYLLTNDSRNKFIETLSLDWFPRLMILNKSGQIVLYKAFIEIDYEKISYRIKKLDREINHNK